MLGSRLESGLHGAMDECVWLGRLQHIMSLFIHVNYHGFTDDGSARVCDAHTQYQHGVTTCMQCFGKL